MSPNTDSKKTMGIHQDQGERTPLMITGTAPQDRMNQAEISRLDKDLRYRLSELRRRVAGCALQHPTDLVQQFQQQLDDLAHRLARATAVSLAQRRSRLAASKLVTPREFIRGQRQRLEAQHHRLTTGLDRRRQETRQRLRGLASHLDLLSPNSTLARGYSITRLADGKVVRTMKRAPAGTTIRTRVTDGEFESVVSKP